MKKKLFYVLFYVVFILFGINFNSVTASSITIVSGEKYEKINIKTSRGEAINFLVKYLDGKIPKSFKYIDLNIKGIEVNSELYRSLQKLVFLDIINNKNTYFFKDKPLSKYAFYGLAGKIFNRDFLTELNIKKTNKDFILKGNLDDFNSLLIKKQYEIGINNSDKKIQEKKEIFLNVYKTLKTSHYNRDSIDEVKMMDSAIVGLTKGVGDKYTVYFPPVDNKDFNETLNGKYEGIGAYVDMEKPGLLKIVSPISGSPSEKAGLKGGDIVTKVDGKILTSENGLREVISWIKGPAGSKVTLTIKRGSRTFEMVVVRAKIIIKDVEYRLINNKTFYIKLKFFGATISKDFRLALEELNKHKNVKKVIIDLRNNPGGYLGQVTDMLSYFVEQGKSTAVVKYRKSEKKYYSKGYDLVDFSKFDIVILQNSGSASASEIMIGTIKDYYPDVKLLGEKTYGKGSVQTISEYSDGSSLKYTIAKWFTGKYEIGIDGIGIKPTLEIEDNYSKGKIDTILNRAIIIRK